MRSRPRTLVARSWDSVSGLFRLRDFRKGMPAPLSGKARLNLENLEPREVPAAVLVRDVQHFNDPSSAFIPFGNTSTTLTLNRPVAMNRTLVTGSTNHPADWAGNSIARFELVDTNGSPTTAEAVRVTRGGNGGNSTSGRLDFSVDVTEFWSGVTVEQKEITIGSTATSATATLGTSWVSDRTFVVLSQSTTDDTPNYDARWSARGSLTGSGSTLTVSRTETGAAIVVAAQVLTLDEDSGSKVQSGQLTLSSATASASYTTTSGAGDLLFFSADAPAATTGVEAKYRVRGTASGGTVNFATLAAGGSTVDYFVVSIDRATVQTGEISFAAATTDTGGSSSIYSQSASIASVDPSRSFVQVTASGGDSSRRDTLGDTAFKATLGGSNSVVLTRADRTDTPVVPTYGNGSAQESVATAAWSVVEWPTLLRAPIGTGGDYCPAPLVGANFLTGTNGGNPATYAPVRYADGTITIGASDLSADSAGGYFGIDRSWTNGAGYQAPGSFGTGWLQQTDPYLQDFGSSVAVVLSGTDAEFFDLSGGTFVASFYSQNRLVLDSVNGWYVYTDTSGTKLYFEDFAGGTAAERGRLLRVDSPDGTEVEVVSRTATGAVSEMVRSRSVDGVPIVESLLYSYVPSGVNADLVSSVVHRRQTNGGSWETVRTANYSYYGTSEAGGPSRHLKTATVVDGSSGDIDTTYYRYYNGESGGAAGLLKSVMNPGAFAQAVAAFGSTSALFAASDTAIETYVDNYFEYDAAGRVTLETASSAGCSVCSGGQGTTIFTYTKSAFADGPNSWKTKTVVTYDDGSIDTIFTNANAQVMLKAHAEPGVGSPWLDYYRFDSAGRMILHANPSAVTGFDESKADLVNFVAGNAQYLADSTGLIETSTYSTSTTATTSTAGNVAGYLQSTAIRRGELGTDVLQGSLTYITRTADGLDTFHVATQTVYANDNGTGGRTTSFEYAWYAGTHAAYSVTTTMPTVSTAQNGSGTAAVTTTVLDQWGRMIWSKDADGFLTYMQYDPGTGAVVKMIADVDTTQTGTFADLPSGWTTPSGGGVHLTSTAEVDDLGRTTKSVDPKGNITYTVYNDVNHEIRVYRSWNTTTNTPTGPTEVYREDRAGRYSESLTMSATPNLTSGRPNGTEAISNIESLSRSYRNEAGQTVRSDTYFDLTGITYSTAANIGTQNVNYLRTTQDYDKQGRPNKSVSAAGTIYRTEFDGLGRVVSEWVGTDDTPTTGFWAVTNTAGTNMVKVREYEYDGGSTGDSNLTKVTEFPGGSATDRVTQSFFDWRNRTVATKSGVETSESTSVNRPISYAVFNNLGEVLASEMYDGDGVTVVDADSNGVPDRPSTSLLRTKSTAEYDAWGRAFRSTFWSVDPSTGAVSSTGLVSQSWFDLRGNAVKSSSPGGVVSKSQYDGVGRTTVSFVTDGGGDTTYADAFTVTGDIVLSQGEYAYDANSNVILTTSRDRFHNATGTGSLGTPSTGVNARVSYSTAYYDLADRTTDVVNVGTNGGSAYTRPGTVPSRSDTVLVTSYEYDSAGRLEFVTDPRGLVSQTVYDLLGRTTKSIENYVDGLVSDADDKTTVYGYGPAGMTSITSLVTGGGGQTTEYVYGVSTGTGSTITSNDIVGTTKWPDPTTGSASASEQETTTVNSLGQTLTATDRNGNVHTLTFDVLGRVVSDAVTTLGSGVNGAVRRIEYGYDGQGNQFLVTSYDAASSGSVVNQVKRDFNGLGQLTTVWQSHAGAVTGTTPKVGYTYSEMAGGANHSRLTGMTYPSGYAVAVNYASGLDTSISRLSSFSDTSGTLVDYSYLGLGTVVIEDRPQPDFALSHVLRVPEALGDGGDIYTGLDRFGRVERMRWLDGTGTAVDWEAYTHDRDGNRLTSSNQLNSDFDESYTYDGLNQLTAFDRNSGDRTQAWDYDSQGNMQSVTTDGTPETRTHNAQNEVTGVGSNSLTFDSNGNMTTDETGRQFVYDAWNRLVVVKDSGGATLKTFGYDGTGWRVTETVGSTTRDFYYSAGWQVVEETFTTGSTTLLNARYVWGNGYVDDLVYRQRDTDNDGVLDERVWATNDANFNITTLVDDLGNVVERYAYDAYGVQTVMDAGWNVLSGSAYGMNYGYQGRPYDAVSGTNHFRRREVSPTLGRPLQVDPLGLAPDINPYRWEGNSPLMGLDPWGLDNYSVPAGWYVDARTGLYYREGTRPETGGKAYKYDEIPEIKNRMSDDLSKGLEALGAGPMKRLMKWTKNDLIKLLSKSPLTIDLLSDLDNGTVDGNKNCRLRVVAFMDIDNQGKVVAGREKGSTKPNVIGVEKSTGALWIKDPITIEINAALTLEDAALTLAHEWVHAKQYCGCNRQKIENTMLFELEAYTFEAEVAISLNIKSEHTIGTQFGPRRVDTSGIRSHIKASYIDSPPPLKDLGNGIPDTSRYYLPLWRYK